MLKTTFSRCRPYLTKVIAIGNALPSRIIVRYMSVGLVASSLPILSFQSIAFSSSAYNTNLIQSTKVSEQANGTQTVQTHVNDCKQNDVIEIERVTLELFDLANDETSIYVDLQNELKDLSNSVHFKQFVETMERKNIIVHVQPVAYSSSKTIEIRFEKKSGLLSLIEIELAYAQ
jgi:hypothetical protein